MSTLAQAASVLLAQAPGSTELLVVRRAEALRFFGGFLAFPGGKLASADAEVAARFTQVDPPRVTAARELFEETGILLARRTDRSFPPSDAQLEQLRRDLLADHLRFTDVLSRLDATLCANDFIPLGELTTPAFSPLRYATHFFLAYRPTVQQAAIWPGELQEGFWSSAADVVERWTHCRDLVTPPSIMMLQALAGRPIDEAALLLPPQMRALAAGALHPIFFAPEVQLLPLRTRALPPTTHTNAYLVGRQPMYLLDPGSPFADEQQRLYQVLDAHQAAGRRLTAIVLTHQHPDHIEGAPDCAARYDVPIWAHPLTARALEGKVRIDRLIEDGDHLDLGTAPDGSAGWHLVAVHTPGHAAGHLAFYDPHCRLLFAGDMISTMTSVVIAPPDGDLALYLESLRRLRGYPARLLLPSHGNASARPEKTIDEALAHRLKREEELVAALASGPRRVADLVPELYRGLAKDLLRFAEMQIEAGLRKLEREERAAVDGKGMEPLWRLR